MSPFIRALRLAAPSSGEARDGYPWTLPAVGALQRDGGLALHPRITYLVGENGSGKSTLLEALAVACGINPEGGSSSFVFDDGDGGDPHRYAFTNSPAHRALGEALTLVRGGRRPRGDFFLRAQGLFTAAAYVDELGALDAYGGRSLHAQSHGESFLAVLLNRFGPGGLYLLDEPEAALSVQNQLTCVGRIDELVRAGSQFVIATHSPVVLSHPDALIYELSAEDPPEAIAYGAADSVRLSRAFLDDPARFLDALLEPG